MTDSGDQSAMSQVESLVTPIVQHRPYIWRMLFVATITGILSIVLLFPFSQTGRQWSELFNLAHAPSFLLAFLILAGLFDPSCIGFPKSWHQILPLGVVRLIVLACVLLAIGATCEFLQGYVGRSPSLSDVVANGCGVVAGLFWCLSRRRIAVAGRIGILLIAAGLLIMASWSPIAELHECWLQHQDFPLLSSFERTRELHGWSAHEATIGQSKAWSTHGSSSMRVHGLAATTFPGASLLSPINNWNGFNTLELDVFNPGDTQLQLRINIADNRHPVSGYASQDRFKSSFELPPLKHVHIRIELADVKKAPESRSMDMSQIASINLFIVRPEADIEFMVDQVQLTGNSTKR